jgi:hypothetical protein
MYKLLRSPGTTEPDPLFISNEKVGTNSRQYKDRLLCWECEDRFSKLGETWVIGNCWREDEIFPIRDALRARPPVEHMPGILTVYEAASVPFVKTDHILYFAASVFWRAAVHRWKIPGHPTVIETNLGSYEEAMRLFLLQQAPFPSSMALIVRVAEELSGVRVAWMPNDRNYEGFRRHQFGIPGLSFWLLVGGKIPAIMCSASFNMSPQRFMIFQKQWESDELKDLVRNLGDAQLAPAY